MHTPYVYIPFPFFFFTYTATTEIYTLSLHDALPISLPGRRWLYGPTVASSSTVDDSTTDAQTRAPRPIVESVMWVPGPMRSEEHTSELQSRRDLVCRLLLEKKKKNN